MTSLIQQLRTITSQLPEKDRFLSGLAMRDYYEKSGQLKPTKPIQRSLKVGTQFCNDNFNYRQLPLDATQADAIVWQVTRSKDDYNYFHPIFEKYPHDITQYFANKYVNLFKEKGAKVANTFFRKTLGSKGVIDSRINLVQKQYFGTNTKLSTAFMHKFVKLPEYSREQIALLATEIANFINDDVFTFISKVTPKEFNLNVIPNGEQTLAHDAYCYLVDELKGLNIRPPYYVHYQNGKLTEDEASAALAKTTDIDWWERQLKRRRDHQKEHLAIAAGQVQNKASPYASKSCQFEWREQKQNNRDWAKNQVIENEDGEQFELTLQIDKSNANPAIRRCELMVRMRGFEDLADEYGYMGVFVTITAPAKYHSCHSKGGFVDNWIGNNPRQTQSYLCNVWAKIRAKLSRDEIRYFGFRVVEPHHDGTPHWHLLVFIDPNDRDTAESIMHKYALEVDGNEPGAAENRFKFVDIEKEKGSATGYIAKYISKNIDGYALNGEMDDETGQDFKTMSKAVTAWASRWRIRQFQQIGGAPVTVYRELRRLKDKKVQDENIDPILAAADVGCWATYTELQGGAMVKRKDLKVRISYEEKFNQFEEVQQKIKGIFSPITGLSSFIRTRLIKWKIVKKSKQSKDLDLKNSAARAPWSSVNNCTQDFKNEVYDQRENVRKELQKRKIRFEEHHISGLIGGRLLCFNDNLLIKVLNNDLIYIELPPYSHDDHEIMIKRSKIKEVLHKPLDNLKDKERSLYYEILENSKVLAIDLMLKATPKKMFFPDDIKWSF